MPILTDNSAVLEHDSHSDSDWLDIASTDRDSDDNDSIYSSRETDHEDLSRSRSRRSSLSYGSSRDGDVDAWEGLIDDSADEGAHNGALAPNPHVPSLPQHSPVYDSSPAQETSLEELLVKEGLDQSMISTLSSSRSSSLHTSTVHNSSRDLRLSFPDPITSSCREPLSTSYEEIQHDSAAPLSPIDLDGSSDARQVNDEEMLSASQILPVESQAAAVPSSSGPELKVFLYGISTVFKWTIVHKLLQKVVHGAGLAVTSDLATLQSTRHLTVSGSFEHDRAFPRIITVLDRTLRPHDFDDLALMTSANIRPLAVVFMPCRPPRLPQHVLYLPVQVLPSYSGELANLSDIEIGFPQDTPGTLDIPSHRLLRITAPEDPLVINKDTVDMLDSTRVYRTFSRLWSSDNNTPKGVMASPHALTIIAILSLVLGIIVRAALPTSLQYFASPTFAPFGSNHTSGFLWQILRPSPSRERLPLSTSLDSSVLAVSTSFRELSLSVFNVESTSMTLSRAHPTNFRRIIPSTLSESLEFPKELMLQPPCSVLLMDDRPKALSVIPETSPTASYHPGPTAPANPICAFTHASVSAVVKEYGAIALTTVNKDMQDIFDALDDLVRAIVRQTQIIITETTTLFEQSLMRWEKGVESFEMVKETLHGRNERARRRAKEIREIGAKLLYDASEAITAGAQLSKEVAWEVAEGLASGAQRARGRAKEIAAEIQGLLNEHEKFEALGTCAWDVSTKQWGKWVKRTRNEEMGKSCQLCTRKLGAMFC